MKKGILIVYAATMPIFGLFAQPLPSREDAFNNPSRHAWNLFLQVNHPALDPKLGRGIPDPSKKIGTPGTTVVWETWRLSETEVFLEKGAPPPEDFNDLSLPGGPTSGKVPEIPKAELLKFLAANPDLPGGNQQLKALELKVRPQFDPVDGIFQGFGGFGESRMNKATYDFVYKNHLYSLQGQQRYAAEYLNGTKPALTFPVDSIEVKAAWIEFSKDDLIAKKNERFYVAEYAGKIYGLASLHIITKDSPDWFWCTFHHKEAPIPEPAFGHGVGNGDKVGQPVDLNGTVWENYALGGTQTSFVESTGRPTLLSDALVEKGFVASSCISCHARATVQMPSTPALGSNPVVGAPRALDYFFPDAIDPTKPGKPKLMQTDFLFSLAFRAKSEN